MGDSERLMTEHFAADGFRIVHFLDDDKFTDMAISLFESVYPGKSLYYIMTDREGPMIHVTSNLAKRVSLENANQIADFAKQISADGAAVFLHALSFKRQLLALFLPKQIVKVWFVWGYDLYQKWPFFRRRIFETETAQYLKSLQSQSNFMEVLRYNHFSFWLYTQSRQSYVPNWLGRLAGKLYQSTFYQAAQAIDIVAPVIPTEYALIQTMKIKAAYAPFTYGNLEDLMGDKIDQNVLQAQNILVGNSADPANNHLDIFKKLAHLDLGHRKVYVPLSYAGNEKYKALVLEKGKAYLGDCFVPLTQFMKLEEYNKIVAGCGLMIFNHIRQQGVGNIILMGAMGAKIFLNPKSTVYGYYKSLGIKVWSIADLNQQQLQDNLSIEDWHHNRNLYFEHYSKKAVQAKARKLLTIVGERIQENQ